MCTEPVTSEVIRKMLHTNPVVVRQKMALLKNAEFVTSIKGYNGGWLFVVKLFEITLYDIHCLTGEGAIFTIGLTDEHNNCQIENLIQTRHFYYSSIKI